MRDLPGLSIEFESPTSESVRDLVRLSAAVTGGDDAHTASDLCVPNAEFLVARLDGAPVGCIALLDRIDFGEVRRLFVSEEARGQGIAVALVTALEAAARDVGLRQVRVSDTGASRDAFAKLGFQPGAASSDRVMEKVL